MLTSTQIDTLTEIFNIGVGRAGSVLGELMGSKVTLHVPSVGLSRLSTLSSCLSLADETELASVHQTFSGSLAGQALLLFPRQSGSDLARQLIADDPEITCIDSERAEALTEVGNILLNSVLGSIANALDHRFDYEVPLYREAILTDLLQIIKSTEGESADDSMVLYANADFDIQKFMVTGNVLIAFGVLSFGQLLARVDQLTLEQAGT